MSALLLCRHVEMGETTHAEHLAGALAPLDLAAIYTSPLARAVQTADAVAARHDLRPIEVDALREIDFGDVDELAFDAYPAELQTALIEAPGSARFPGGESYAELQARVCAALEEILAAHRGETIAVITHAGPIRAALAHWLAIPADASFRVDQRYGAVNVVEFADGVPFVRLVNGTRPSG
jgi:broad specificity phosphatase PhoE